MINKDKNRKNWLSYRRGLLIFKQRENMALVTRRDKVLLNWKVDDAKAWMIENGCVCAFDRSKFLDDNPKLSRLRLVLATENGVRVASFHSRIIPASITKQ